MAVRYMKRVATSAAPLDQKQQPPGASVRPASASASASAARARARQ